MMPKTMLNLITHVIIVLLLELVTLSMGSDTCREPSNSTEIKANLTEKIQDMYVNDLPFLSIPTFREAVKLNIVNYPVPGATATRAARRSSRRNGTFLSHIYGHRRCSSYRNANIRRKWDTSRASTCPWSVFLHQNIDRTPRTITIAMCACKYCMHPDQSIRRRGIGRCEPVNTHMPVIMRSCVSGEYVYRIEVEAVPVGCTCVRPEPPLRHRNHEHRPAPPP